MKEKEQRNIRTYKIPDKEYRKALSRFKKEKRSLATVIEAIVKKLSTGASYLYIDGIEND